MSERRQTTIRAQDSRDYPGGTTLVLGRGNGENHTECTLADLIELQRVVSIRIAALNPPGVPGPAER